MTLFMIGYVTTTSFGPYFFKYAYGNEDMYSVFGGILIVTQIVALSVFPLFRKRFTRNSYIDQHYPGSSRLHHILFIPNEYDIYRFIRCTAIRRSGIIQLLMLMFLADTVEYGQWKLGKRNESVTFALQPFINKMGGAIGTGIVGATVIISGINDAKEITDVTSGGLMMMKIAMFIVPLLFYTCRIYCLSHEVLRLTKRCIKRFFV